MDALEQWNDLEHRLNEAAGRINELAHDTMDERERQRLLAKAEGIMLASDYMRGYDEPEAKLVLDHDAITQAYEALGDLLRAARILCPNCGVPTKGRTHAYNTMGSCIISGGLIG